MDIVFDLSGQNTPVLQRFFADGEGTNIVRGALVEAPDVAGSTGLGAVEPIGVVAAPVDIVGRMSSLLDVSADGEWEYDSATIATDETKRPERDIDIRPLAVYRAQVDESSTTFYNTADTVSTAITTDATWTADDLVGDGWLYDDATEQLRRIKTHNATTTFVLASATTTAVTNAQDRAMVLVPPRLYGSGAGQGMTVSSTFDNILIKGDETILWAKVVDVWFQAAKGVGLERLNPKHDAATVSSAKFFVDFVIADHMFNPLS